jgi:hypothetical protein
MPLVILHHLLNVSVQFANERGLKKLPVVFMLITFGKVIIIITPWL